MTEETPGAEPTPAVAWLTVVMGAMLLMGNVAELGGLPLAAREWTAWLIAGLILVHGVSMAWRWGKSDDSWRIPRWPLFGLAWVGFLAFTWWRDDANPAVSRETFILVFEGWLLCWVVAATPGSRSLSWAWLFVLAVGAVLAFTTAFACQAMQDGLWLPLGRRLPAIWLGRWSGTLPLPGAFGALMIMAGPPLLVLACVPRMPLIWRVLCGGGGLAMLLGALMSFSLGAWMGVAVALGLVPPVVTLNRMERWVGWAVGAVLLTIWLVFLYKVTTINPLSITQAGEPAVLATLAAGGQAWHTDPWLGGGGAPFAQMAQAAGLPSPAGGWSYGGSDWSELAARWGLAGFGLAGALFIGLLLAAWYAWDKLPYIVAVHSTPGDTQRSPPEAKVLLGAAVTGLTAYLVTMLAERTLNLPALVFAFAILTGVLARNIPQRGGTLRPEPGVRCAVALGMAMLVATLLIGKVGLVAAEQQKLAEAEQLLQIADRQPDAELLVRARADLREVIRSDPGSVDAYCNSAWLELEQARLNPGDIASRANQAEYFAISAASLAPRSPQPWLICALACRLANRPQDAATHLHQAQDLAPSDPAVQYYSMMFASLDSAAGRSMALPPRYYGPPSWPPLMGLPAAPAGASLAP